MYKSTRRLGPTKRQAQKKTDVVTHKPISLFRRRRPAAKKSGLLTEQLPRPINQFSRDQPPITRARAWENWDRKGVECNVEAGELNEELAKLFNGAIKQIDQSDRDQLDWYWRCWSELFNLLDVLYLLMVEPGTKPIEALHIANAARRHFRHAVGRWQIHQRELRKLREENYRGLDIV